MLLIALLLKHFYILLNQPRLFFIQNLCGKMYEMHAKLFVCVSVCSGGVVV